MSNGGGPGAGAADSRRAGELRPWQRRALAVFFSVMGVTVTLAAIDAGPMASAQRNAPRWVVAAGGAVFLCGGALLLFPTRRLASLLAGVVVALLTAVFGWVALLGDRAGFDVGPGGILSADAQVLVARVIFALVAVLGLAILVRAWCWYRRK